MLVYRSASTFICLRCQLKLANPKAIPTLSQRIPQASFSTFRAVRDLDRDDGLVKRHKWHRPLGRIRGRRGKKLREASAPLGVNVLGNPAEIIVLRDVPEGELDVGKDAALEYTPDESTEKNDLLASLQSEGSPITQAEVNKQIDGLRPPSSSYPGEPIYLQRKPFAHLSKTLADSFTVQQLSRYLSDITIAQKDAVQEELYQGAMTSKGKRAANQTPWHPGTTPLDRSLFDRIPQWMKGRRHAVGKAMVAEQILRQAWNVVLLEEIESLGEMELVLKEWQITLLSSGAVPTPLDQIAQARNARFDFRRQHNVIRISADKTSAEYAAEDIAAALRKTELLRFSMARWKPYLSEGIGAQEGLVSVFSRKEIATVEKLSGALIQAISHDAFQIRGLNKTQTEDAQRYLLAILPFDSSKSRDCFVDIAQIEEGKATIQPTAFKEFLDFRYRDRDLGRWTLPITKLPESSEDVDEESSSDSHEPSPLRGISLVEEQVLRSLRDSLSDSALPEDFSHKGVRSLGKTAWARDIETSIIAEFGQALLPIQRDDTNQPANSLSTGISQSHKAVFSPKVPGLLKVFNNISGAEYSVSDTERLEYRFVPVPKDDFEARSKIIYPQLIFRLTMEDQRIDLGGIGLLINEHTADALLPQQVSDIRFKKTQMVWLRSPLGQKIVNDCFEAICKNLRSGKRLNAPPLKDFTIPRWAIRGAGYDWQSHLDSNENIALDYKLAGLEHRQTVFMGFQGHSLRYSGVQAGQLAGKGERLELCYSRADKLRQAAGAGAEIEVLAKFVGATFALTKQITEAAQNLRPMARLLTPKRNLRQIETDAPYSNSSVVGSNLVEVIEDVSPSVMTHEPFDNLEYHSEAMTGDDGPGPEVASNLFDWPEDAVNQESASRKQSSSTDEPFEGLQRSIEEATSWKESRSRNMEDPFEDLDHCWEDPSYGKDSWQQNTNDPFEGLEHSVSETSAESQWQNMKDPFEGLHHHLEDSSNSRESWPRNTNVPFEGLEHSVPDTSTESPPEPASDLLDDLDHPLEDPADDKGSASKKDRRSILDPFG